MALFYDEVDNKRPQKPMNGLGFLMDLDPNLMYNKHFEIYLQLKFFANHGNVLEKTQAAKEMLVVDRKMKFWENMNSFDDDRKEVDMVNARKKWEGLV